jgi:hypothetical protein
VSQVAAPHVLRAYERFTVWRSPRRGTPRPPGAPAGSEKVGNFVHGALLASGIYIGGGALLVILIIILIVFLVR